MPEQTASGRAHRPFLPALFVSIVFGAAAGAVGTLLVFAYVAPSFASLGAALVAPSDGARRQTEEAAVASLEPAGRAAVMLALSKSGSGLLDRAYVPGDALGAGLVLTSDGWIVAYGDGAIAKMKRPQDLVAVIGARAYPVRRVVRDPYSGAAFLKVEAANLPVTAFGSTEGIGAGETLYSPDAAGGFRRLFVTAYDVLPAKTGDDLLRSSERMQRQIRATGGPLPVGAMALDRKGEVVGVVADEGPFGLVIVPVEAFSGVIGPVLRDKEPVRPMLGVHYVDLSQVAEKGGEGPVRGALLAASADGKQPAVSRKSPAEAAGLSAGDVIVAIDGAQVSAKNPLADALAGYEAGDDVTLTVLRDGKPGEISVDVTLGTAPALQ
ncbi:MAG: hypothetical protein RL272_102 [Candidatus Parcubacteria bacterium]|jgi:serine protease Do